ncbi:MAG: branched-chain amino acid transaminase [Deltaproteobacteria bacterium]|nr:branched-chain amino acid transaminase [Deltaproteobacteria bacterium]
MVQKTKKIWMDGAYIDWDKANVHILTHTLHYGLGVFEGVRCYKQADGTSAIFRLKEHMNRLYESAHMFWIKIPYAKEELISVSKEIYKINGLEEGYLRPLVYIGDGAMGINAPENPVRVAMITWHWGAYLGEEGLTNGIRTKFSSFNRLALNVNFSKSKACGNYINSILAKREAKLAGYEEALMLDRDGYLAEGSGENIFIVKDGIVRTPPQSSSILNGITRLSVIQILQDHKIPVKEEMIVREDVYVADEIFLTGTAAEITPVREVDHHEIGTGKPGPITKKVQEIFFDAVRGKISRYKEWLEVL